MKVLLLLGASWAFLGTGFPITAVFVQAQGHCPARIPAMRFRIVAGALVVVPARVNGDGPYDFIVDTGSQLNVIDPFLAAQLGLKSRGTVGLVSATTRSQAQVTVLDSVEAGSYLVTKSLAAVHDLGPFRAADLRIRGVLGESYLAHFDVLIDYKHTVLCLDKEKLMQSEIRGDRIPLMPPGDPKGDVPFAERLVIQVMLPAIARRPILLQLDSGSDGPILFARHGDMNLPLLQPARLSDKKMLSFAALPKADIQVGARKIRGIRFVTPVSAPGQRLPDRDDDGLLATILFRRVYISHTDHYVILDPR